jgi:hypothetical protein
MVTKLADLYRLIHVARSYSAVYMVMAYSYANFIKKDYTPVSCDL